VRFFSLTNELKDVIASAKIQWESPHTMKLHFITVTGYAYDPAIMCWLHIKMNRKGRTTHRKISIAGGDIVLNAMRNELQKGTLKQRRERCQNEGIYEKNEGADQASLRMVENPHK